MIGLSFFFLGVTASLLIVLLMWKYLWDFSEVHSLFFFIFAILSHPLSLSLCSQLFSPFHPAFSVHVHYRVVPLLKTFRHRMNQILSMDKKPYVAGPQAASALPWAALRLIPASPEHAFLSYVSSWLRR